MCRLCVGTLFPLCQPTYSLFLSICRLPVACVPPVISGELWQKANEALTKRGRGRGKQGKSIQSLLRNRIICPRCGKPMVVRRDGHNNCVYYHCSKHYRPWDNEACTYRRFVPGTWDETVWDFVCALLSDNAWIDEQITVEQSRQASAAKLLDTEQRKIIQIQSKIAKIQEGFEAGIYSVDEAKKRIAVCQNAITHAEQELERLRQLSNARVNAFDTDSLRRELKALGEMNLNEASFEERLDVVSKLDIKVYPSEDLKTIRIKCGLNLNVENDVVDNGVAQCRKIILGPPKVSIGRTLTCFISLPYKEGKKRLSSGRSWLLQRVPAGPGHRLPG